MANRTATLVRNAKLPVVGWRRGLLVTSKDGRVKPDYMMRNGLEVHCPDGHYDIRYYVGPKVQHKNVGADLETAQSALKQFTKKLTATNMLTDLGVSLPGYEKTSTRKTLALQKATFLDKYARGSTDTIALYTVVTNEFVKVLEGKSFAEQIEESDVIRYDCNMERVVSPRLRAQTATPPSAASSAIAASTQTKSWKPPRIRSSVLNLRKRDAGGTHTGTLFALAVRSRNPDAI